MSAAIAGSESKSGERGSHVRPASSSSPPAARRARSLWSRSRFGEWLPLTRRRSDGEGGAVMMVKAWCRAYSISLPGPRSQRRPWTPMSRR